MGRLNTEVNFSIQLLQDGQCRKAAILFHYSNFNDLCT